MLHLSACSHARQQQRSRARRDRVQPFQATSRVSAAHDSASDHASRHRPIDAQICVHTNKHGGVKLAREKNQSREVHAHADKEANMRTHKDACCKCLTSKSEGLNMSSQVL
jgi:hypothetical protein